MQTVHPNNVRLECAKRKTYPLLCCMVKKQKPVNPDQMKIHYKKN